MKYVQNKTITIKHTQINETSYIDPIKQTVINSVVKETMCIHRPTLAEEDEEQNCRNTDYQTEARMLCSSL